MLSMFAPTAAFAAEVETPVSNDVATQETEVSAPSTSGISPRTESFGPGDWYWGGVTFYDENGGAYKTIYGDEVKIKVAFKAVDNDPISYHLFLKFMEYGGRQVYYRDYNSWSDTPDADGYLYYESDWIDVNYGVDYRFLYSSNSECNCNDARRLSVHIWIEVR